MSCFILNNEVPHSILFPRDLLYTVPHMFWVPLVLCMISHRSLASCLPVLLSPSSLFIPMCRKDTDVIFLLLITFTHQLMPHSLRIPLISLHQWNQILSTLVLPIPHSILLSLNLLSERISHSSCASHTSCPITTYQHRPRQAPLEEVTIEESSDSCPALIDLILQINICLLLTYL